MVVVHVTNVLEVDRCFADGVPRVPGDLEDDERDRQADDRVGDLSAESNYDRARDHTERDEAVDAGVVAVGGPIYGYRKFAFAASSTGSTVKRLFTV